MRYDDFTLQVDRTSTADLRVRVLSSPAGEGSSEHPLPDDLISLESLLSARVETHRGPRGMVPPTEEGVEGPSPRKVGARLFEHLMHGRVRTLFDQSLGGSFGAEDRGLRIKLKMDPGDRRIEHLTALPWELLYRAETEDYLALSRRTPIVRYLDVPRPNRPIPLPETLRVLVAMASPNDQESLKLKDEKDRLERAIAGQRGIKLSLVEHATAERVRERLVAERSHVLHFMGHGDFDAERREGLLFFEREDGSSDPLSGRALATSLKDLPDLGLVFLNACNTARSSVPGGGSPFSGVASALVLGGMPAVLAMQFPITDRAAIRFSQAFYRHLASGEPLDIALTEGRHAIHVDNAKSLEWAIPVLFVRVPDGMVFAGKAQPGRPRTRAKLVVVLLLSALSVAVAIPIARWRPWEKETDPDSGVTKPGPEPGAVVKEPPPEPPPAPQPIVFQAAGWRFEVSGSRSFVGSLQQSLTKFLPKTSSSATVRLHLNSPSRQTVELGGTPRASCRLTASGSITRDGATKDLGQATGAGTHMLSDGACEFAADELAERISYQLQSHL